MRIVIAEDDPVGRLVLGTMLRKQEHEITVVENGADAWELLRRDPHPVLITDWMMPAIDGLALCRLVRRTATGPYTYVILLTALSGRQNYLAGMEAGADDFLVKPVDPDELRARLRVAERILGLQSHVRRLEGLLPICMYCKKIREQDDHWTEIERYVTQRSPAEFSHGVCPGCVESRAKPEVEQWKRARLASQS
jgi:DNA-binding response OmpR family regulator